MTIQKRLAHVFVAHILVIDERRSMWLISSPSGISAHFQDGRCFTGNPGQHVVPQQHLNRQAFSRELLTDTGNQCVHTLLEFLLKRESVCVMKRQHGVRVMPQTEHAILCLKFFRRSFATSLTLACEHYKIYGTLPIHNEHSFPDENVLFARANLQL